ncbi:hypothetical protein A2U01_0037414, partial [Trifolium medium]|nr:hypothetical protein [Trifolium medium]
AAPTHPVPVDLRSAPRRRDPVGLTTMIHTSLSTMKCDENYALLFKGVVAIILHMVRWLR